MSFICQICYENFDEKKGIIPKILKCGDTICIKCLETIYKNEKIICPICTKETCDSIDNLRINLFAYNNKNAFVCSICWDEYDNTINSERTPRVLKCGQTICSDCLNKNYDKNKEEIFCTLCAENHKEKLEDIPVNKCVIGLVEEELIKNIDVLTCSNSYDYEISIGLMGDSGVGKTCITHYFYEGKPLYDSLATIGLEFHYKCLKIKKNIVKVRLWDTAGQEQYRSLSFGLLKGVNAVLIVFALALPNLPSSDNTLYDDWENMEENKKKEIAEKIRNDSFNKVRAIYKQYTQIADTQEKIVYLIGNKVDDEKHRVIKKEDAIDLAEELSMEYYETSAFTGENIKTIFFKICQSLIEKFKEKEKKEKQPRKNSIVLNNDMLTPNGVNNKKNKCCK